MNKMQISCFIIPKKRKKNLVNSSEKNGKIMSILIWHMFQERFFFKFTSKPRERLFFFTSWKLFKYQNIKTLLVELGREVLF